MKLDAAPPTISPVKFPTDPGRLTLTEYVVIKFIQIFLSIFPRRIRTVFKSVPMILLNFKTSFILVMLYRIQTGRPDLDDVFHFYCRRKLSRNIEWMLDGPIGRRFFGETYYFLYLGFHGQAALAFSERIDWADFRAGGLWVDPGVCKVIDSTFAMDLVSRLHLLDWTSAPKAMHVQFTNILIRMLEHRQHEYEEIMFEDRKLGECLRTLPLERYCPLFFRDKSLIQSLITELELEGADAILEQLDADGQQWGGYYHRAPSSPLLSDISLFYAYRHLLLRTYHCGEGYLVPKVHNRMIATQERLRRSLPAPSKALARELDVRQIELTDVRLLSPDWSALIGHNGHLNVHLMMHKMGWWEGQPLLLAYKGRVANHPFLSLFSDLCPTVTFGENVSDGVWEELASLTPFLGVSHQAFQFKDGRSMYWNDAGAMALKEWESMERGFPLREIYDHRLAADDEADSVFQGLRKKWGMTPSDWHVCLHMRDAKTRGEKEGAGESIRNTSLENYYDSVRYVTSQGGWVIRMGSPLMPPLPKMPRVIDYACSSDRSPLMDVHLMRRARFFIGTTSGFAYVASSFGIPTAMVNAISSVGLLWSVDTRFALKPVRTRKGRLLTQGEVTSEKWRWTFPTYESLVRAGLTVSENTSDEILETVKEVLSVAGGSTSPESPLMERWRSSLTIPYFYGSAVPSAYFLEKYADSFLDTAAFLQPQL